MSITPNLHAELEALIEKGEFSHVEGVSYRSCIEPVISFNELEIARLTQTKTLNALAQIATKAVQEIYSLINIEYNVANRYYAACIECSF